MTATLTVRSLRDVLLDMAAAAIDAEQDRYAFCPDCRRAPDGIGPQCRDHDEARGRALEYQRIAALIKSAATYPEARTSLLAALGGPGTGERA